MSMSDPILSIILASAVGAMIVLLVVYVVCAYDDPAL